MNKINIYQMKRKHGDFHVSEETVSELIDNVNDLIDEVRSQRAGREESSLYQKLYEYIERQGKRLSSGQQLSVVAFVNWAEGGTVSEGTISLAKAMAEDAGKASLPQKTETPYDSMSIGALVDYKNEYLEDNILEGRPEDAAITDFISWLIAKSRNQSPLTA